MEHRIVRRTGGGLQHQPRAVNRATELRRHQGVVTAAQLKAAAYVAHLGISLTAQLSAEEGQLMPLAESRLKGIVDQFALAAAVAVAQMSY